MAREETNIEFTGREVDEWMSTHNANDMNNVLTGFTSDIQTFCRSLANLYEEAKVPLAILGVCVKVDVSMTDAGSGRLTLLKSQLGTPESLLDRMQKKAHGEDKE